MSFFFVGNSIFLLFYFYFRFCLLGWLVTTQGARGCRGRKNGDLISFYFMFSDENYLCNFTFGECVFYCEDKTLGQV